MIKKLFALCLLIMLCAASAHATPSLTQDPNSNAWILTTQPGDNVQLNLAAGDQFSFVQQAASPSPTPSTSPTPPPTPTPVPSNSPTPTPPPPSPTPTPVSAEVIITSPIDGATVAGNVFLNYTGSPNVSWANLLIDNQYLKSSSSGSGSFVIDTTKLVNGPHNMTVAGKSFPGNKTLCSTRIRVMVKNTTPTPMPPKH